MYGDYCNLIVTKHSFLDTSLQVHLNTGLFVVYIYNYTVPKAKPAQTTTRTSSNITTEPDIIIFRTKDLDGITTSTKWSNFLKHDVLSLSMFSPASDTLTDSYGYQNTGFVQDKWADLVDACTVMFNGILTSLLKSYGGNILYLF